MYKATNILENKLKNYLGSTGGTLQKIWYNHINDFTNYKEKPHRKIKIHLEIVKFDITRYVLVFLRYFKLQKIMY